MPLNLTVTRGFTAAPDVPITADDLNALGLPVVVLSGSVGSADLEADSVTTAKVVPGPYFYALTTGSANAYLATLSPAPSSLTTGLWLCVKTNFANTSAATINVNGLGAKAIVTPANQALTGGEISSGQLIWLQYDGTSFQLVSEPSLPKTLYAVDSGTANAYVVTLGGVTVTTLAQLLGQEIIFKASAANTGASTLNVNGLGATAIKKQGSTALTANDIQTGGLCSVAYDGTQFQVTSFMEAPALPAVGASGAITYPYSFTIDSEGRMTAKSGGMYAGTGSMPALGASTTLTHGLGRTPAFVRGVLVNVTPEFGYSAGDEVDMLALWNNSDYTNFSCTANATTIEVARVNVAAGINGKSGNSTNVWTAANWSIKVYAW